MTDFPRMIYKAGGPHEFNEGRFDYIIVGDEEELARELAAGWRLTTADALAPRIDPVPNDDAPPTRAELESKAHELHIKFDGRTNDEKLAGKIAAKLKG
jgi:hypothetical protein